MGCWRATRRQRSSIARTPGNSVQARSRRSDTCSTSSPDRGDEGDFERVRKGDLAPGRKIGGMKDRLNRTNGGVVMLNSHGSTRPRGQSSGRTGRRHYQPRARSCSERSAPPIRRAGTTEGGTRRRAKRMQGSASTGNATPVDRFDSGAWRRDRDGHVCLVPQHHEPAGSVGLAGQAPPPSPGRRAVNLGMAGRTRLQKNSGVPRSEKVRAGSILHLGARSPTGTSALACHTPPPRQRVSGSTFLYPPQLSAMRAPVS